MSRGLSGTIKTYLLEKDSRQLRKRAIKQKGFPNPTDVKAISKTDLTKQFDGAPSAVVIDPSHVEGVLQRVYMVFVIPSFPASLFVGQNHPR